MANANEGSLLTFRNFSFFSFFFLIEKKKIVAPSNAVRGFEHVN